MQQDIYVIGLDLGGTNSGTCQGTGLSVPWQTLLFFLFKSPKFHA